MRDVVYYIAITLDGFIARADGTLDQYLFSRTLERTPDESVTLDADAVGRVRQLKGRRGDSIWLCGGSALAGDLCAADLVDEVIVKVNPIVFGDGKPMFGQTLETSRLELQAVKRFHSGHLILTYRVVR